MKHLKMKSRPMLRSLLGFVLFIAALYFFVAAEGPMPAVWRIVVGLILSMISAGLLSPLISESIGAGAAGMLWRGDKLKHSLPIYSRVDALRARGRFEEALEELRHIAASHPHEQRPWLERLDILIFDLADLDRARACIDEARRLLRPEEGIVQAMDERFNRNRLLLSERRKSEQRHHEVLEVLKSHRWSDDQKPPR